MRYVFLLLAVLVSPAAAEDVSPWFGSTDQVPFQLTADGRRVDADMSSDHLTTASVTPAAPCSIMGCSVAEGSAKVLGAGHVSP